jgi:hypothetical protein
MGVFEMPSRRFGRFRCVADGRELHRVDRPMPSRLRRADFGDAGVHHATMRDRAEIIVPGLAVNQYWSTGATDRPSASARMAHADDVGMPRSAGDAASPDSI